MELHKIKDAFDRVAKKQRLSSSKTQEMIDHVHREIEQIITKVQTDMSYSDPSHPTSVLAELKNKLNEVTSSYQLESSQKDLNIELNKYAKVLDKSLTPDISKAYRNVDFDIQLLNQIIISYFYRQGMFDIGDSFVEEAKIPDGFVSKTPFLEMYAILEAIKSKNLESVLCWACKQSSKLSENGSSLELKLHHLRFIEIVQKGNRDEALAYAKTYLAPLASVHKHDIPKLIGCILWAGRLPQSPYAEFISPTHWDRLAEEFTRQFCSLLSQSYRNALRTVIDAGVQGLPTLLKLVTVMSAKKHEWQGMKQLPVPVDIAKEFQFHSIFVCPVQREQVSGGDNPPMLMPCAHVLSKQSIVKLSKNSARAFKCPYCPLEATVAQCRQLHF